MPVGNAELVYLFKTVSNTAPSCHINKVNSGAACAPSES